LSKSLLLLCACLCSDEVGQALDLAQDGGMISDQTNVTDGNIL
jgi:hypothetical protein